MVKIKKTIYIAIFVSLASQIRFNFITDGFIIAMSVAVMAIFIYCYEDLSPRYVAFCSGIFSPLIRLLFMVLEGGQPGLTAILVIPDMAFFFTYGILYTLVYKYIIRAPKDIRNFPYVIFLCDFLSNIAELFTRSLIQGYLVIAAHTVISLVIVAFCRTVLIQVILLALETYSNLLIKEEHDKEYRKLIVQASIFESELHVMEKNAAEIEDIMRQAFALYKSMEGINAPKELKDCSLDISKNAHEIKGDYLNIINVLKDTFLDDIDEGRLAMKDIISIEKANLQSTIKNRGYHVELITRVKANFYVRQYFKMMSIIRNLILNSAEAIGPTGGKIALSLREDGENYVLEVKDNGPGIDRDDLETVFFDGYSTKFNLETGNVQRGLGLTLVKDYVENIFHGTIAVHSEKGRRTEFVITIPKTSFEEETDEVLHH